MITPKWQEVQGEYGTYRATTSVVDGGTSDAVQILYNSARTSVGLYPEGEAYVAYTLSPIADVNNDTATWIKWPLGNLTVNGADSLISTATAVRLVSVTGAATIDVVSQ